MMKKVYTRKRSKSIKNPFQNNQDSFLANIKLALLLFTLSSIVFTFILLFGIGGDVDHPSSNENDTSDSTFIKRSKRQFLKHKKKFGQYKGDIGAAVDTKSLFKAPLSSFQNHVDPNLQPMTFTLPTYEIGNERKEETFQAYIQPHISSFYNKVDPSMEQLRPQFHGEAGKFINLSNEDLVLYWGSGRNKQFIADVRPFQAVGTATFPGHRFMLERKSDAGNVLIEFHVVADKSIYYYDPYLNDDTDEVMLDKINEELSKDDKELYWLQRNNLEFGKAYLNFTGRQWLSLYPLRKPPSYHMWNADYFGQEHWVTSKQKHYVSLPPEDLLGALGPDEYQYNILDQHRHLSDYRQDGEYLNMTLKVLSCAPRAFEIKNFLSHVEVDHIVHMATGKATILYFIRHEICRKKSMMNLTQHVLW